NPARHGEGGRGRPSVGYETSDNDAREGSQLGSGVGQEFAGGGISLVGGVQDDAKQARKIWWWRRVGSLHKFVEAGELPGLKDHPGQRGFESLIASAQD